MRVLVTGGAGYIGSHAAHLLVNRGHEVVVLDNLSTGHRFLTSGLKLVIGDTADRQALLGALSGVDAVMHFAAFSQVGESVRYPRKYWENNIRSGIELVNAVIDSNVRLFVFSSTAAVYGIPNRVPIPEDASTSPFNCYGATKLAFEYALHAYGGAYDLRFASLRYFNAAGADEGGDLGEIHQPETHLIPSALHAAAGRRSILEIFGDDYPTPDGTCIRDYIHVSDLVEAHVLALEHLKAGNPSLTLNLATGSGYSVHQVLNAVEAVTGKKVPVRISARRAGDPPILVADASQAQRVLSWRPTRSLHQMVSSAWHFMQRHPAPPN